MRSSTKIASGIGGGGGDDVQRAALTAEMFGRVDAVDVTKLRTSARPKVSNFSARSERGTDELDFRSEHGTRGSSKKPALGRTQLSPRREHAGGTVDRWDGAIRGAKDGHGGTQRRSLTTVSSAYEAAAQSAGGRVTGVRSNENVPTLVKQGSYKGPPQLSRGSSTSRLDQRASGSTAPLTRGQSNAALDTSTADTIGPLSRTSSGITTPLRRGPSGIRPPPLSRGSSGLAGAGLRPNRSKEDLQKAADGSGTARGNGGGGGGGGDTARGDGKPTEYEVLIKRSKDYPRGRSIRDIRLVNATALKMKSLALGLIKGPTLISDTIVIGARDDAADGRLLQKLGVTHVLNCAVQLPNPHDGSKKHRFVYLKLPLVDDEKQDLSAFVQPACDFIRRAEEVRGRVLVHCIAGASRSVALVLIYFMIEHKMSLRQIFDYVKVSNTGFFFVWSRAIKPPSKPLHAHTHRRRGRRSLSTTGSRCSWHCWSCSSLGRRRWRRRIAAVSGSSTRGGPCATSTRRPTSPRNRRCAAPKVDRDGVGSVSAKGHPVVGSSFGARWEASNHFF